MSEVRVLFHLLREILPEASQLDRFAKVLEGLVLVMGERVHAARVVARRAAFKGARSDLSAIFLLPCAIFSAFS